MREKFVAILTEYDFNHGEAYSYLIGCFFTREEAEQKSEKYLTEHIDDYMTEDQYKNDWTEEDVEDRFSLEWHIKPYEIDI
jgi:hypothetical protein